MAEAVTIGVLISVPEPHATALTGWRRRVGDPQADTIAPHVTLLPPTDVDPGDFPSIEKHLDAAAQRVAPFAMHLAGTGTFRPVSPVVFVQVSRGVGDCEILERAIRTGPLHRELDFPYHPHVTVAQDIPDAGLDDAYDGLAGFLARFAVDRFTLFEAVSDGKWHARAHFVLGAGIRRE